MATLNNRCAPQHRQSLALGQRFFVEQGACRTAQTGLPTKKHIKDASETATGLVAGISVIRWVVPARRIVRRFGATS